MTPQEFSKLSLEQQKEIRIRNAQRQREIDLKRNLKRVKPGDHIIVGSGKKVHLANCLGQTTCGSSNCSTGVRRNAHIFGQVHVVDIEVNCERCLKMSGQNA